MGIINVNNDIYKKYIISQILDKRSAYYFFVIFINRFPRVEYKNSEQLYFIVTEKSLSLKERINI
jgi:hypothetical protein